MSIAVILPALNEAGAVEAVVAGFREQGARVIVVDNGSTDETAERALAAGATLVREPRRGYGSACTAGIRALAADPPTIVVFADCDGTLDPQDLPRVVAPLEAASADLVLGQREFVDAGALPLHQRAGNLVIAWGLRLLHGVQVRDVPPLRAMRYTWAVGLSLREPTYGLPVETIVLTHRRGGRIAEVPARYRRRAAGRSKVAGSWVGAARASATIMGLLFRLRGRSVKDSGIA